MKYFNDFLKYFLEINILIYFIIFKIIDQEIKKLIEEATEKSRNIIKTHKNQIEKYFYLLNSLISFLISKKD